MNRLLIKTIFTFLICLSFSIIANAECSYNERKELLAEAKKIEAVFTPDYENNKFVFNMFNLSKNLYVELENVKTNEIKSIYYYELIDNKYIYDELNVDNKITYRLNIYSFKEECYASKITSKTITKGIINKYSKMDICKDIQDYKYCKPILNNEIILDESKVIESINNYKENLVKTEESKIKKNMFIEFIKKYKNYIICFFVILLIIYILFLVNKKRGEL